MTDNNLNNAMNEDARPLKKSPQSDDPAMMISGMLINYSIVALVFLAAGVFIGINVSGANGDNLTADEVREIVSNAIADLDVGEGTVDRFELVDDDPYIGAEDAPVVLVEFSDFRCQYCGRHYAQTLEPLLENYGEHIRYVFRDFPALGPESVQAAVAAECADEQGKFWDFHNTMYENQQSLSYEYYIALAERYELDIEAYTNCLDNAETLPDIDMDLIDGQIQGVNGTPGFFINGRFIRGAQPYEVFERYIRYELNQAGIEIGIVGDNDDADDASADDIDETDGSADEEDTDV